ncbi:MAG: hypothetical protein ACOCUI_00900 [bacterium]
MIRCNNCMRTFNSDSDLSKVLITDNHGVEEGEPYKGQEFDERKQEVIDGCPDCLTDSYLTDI